MLQLSYFFRMFLVFLCTVGSIDAHHISERSVAHLRHYHIASIVRAAGKNPLIPKSHYPPSFYRPLNYQQKRHTGAAIPVIATAFTAVDVAIKAVLGISLAGLIAYDNQTNANNIKISSEQREIAANCIQEVQQTLYFGINNEDYKACHNAAVEIIQNSEGMRFEDLKDAIKEKSKQILKESYFRRNPQAFEEQKKYFTFAGQTPLTCIVPHFTIPPTLTHPPVDQNPEIIINRPVLQPNTLPGLQIHQPQAEDCILEKKEEKKPKKSDIEKTGEKGKDKDESKKPKEKRAQVRYDKTPKTNPELFKPVNGTPAKEDPDGNEWQRDKSNHGGPHWDVKGADGKRLKEVAIEDGKVLSLGLKGDAAKFNSSSSDRSTRGGLTPFKISHHNAAVVLSSSTCLNTVDGHLGSVISAGGGSIQQSHTHGQGMMGTVPMAPNVLGNTAVVVTAGGVLVANVGMRSAPNAAAGSQAQLNAAFAQQPSAQIHQTTQTAITPSDKLAELAKAFGDKKPSETTEQKTNESTPTCEQIIATLTQATTASTQSSAPTAAQINATAAQAAPTAGHVTSAEIKSSSSSQSSGASFARTFSQQLREHALDSSKHEPWDGNTRQREYEREILERTERERKRRVDQWAQDIGLKKQDECVIL